MEEGRALLDTDLSRDGNWVAIQAGEPGGRIAVYAVPIGTPPDGPEDWIKIAGDKSWIGAPRWSVNGNILYYISERDDFMCVWGQPLDPATKVPVGEVFSVAHAHTSSMRMMTLRRSMWTLEVGHNRLVFNAAEVTGNVYTAMLEED